MKLTERLTFELRKLAFRLLGIDFAFQDTLMENTVFIDAMKIDIRDTFRLASDAKEIAVYAKTLAKILEKAINDDNRSVHECEDLERKVNEMDNTLNSFENNPIIAAILEAEPSRRY